ncbi:MAG: sensor histidine kinase [Chloroflexi bacterium]|nr:sensor histidine kinase [Chloroflexota bacterium]
MRYLQAMSLLYRLVAVSTIAAAAMAVFVLWVTTEHIAGHASGPHWDVAIPLIAGGLVIALAIVFALTRFVLRPVESLERSIVAFGEGDTSVRARQYPFTDAQITRLTSAFNRMADLLVEKQSNLTEMSSRVIAAQEDERRRLSRELHDDAGQNLTTILLGLKRLETLDSLEQVRERLPSLRGQVSAALDGMRSLAWRLRPSVLDDLGLAAAVRSSVVEFETVAPTRVQLDIDALEARIPGDAEIVLYRVFQEAMTNVARHSHAKTARVVASRSDHILRLMVQDDGNGFSPAPEPLGEHGIGLFGMAERLALIGGVLEIRSAPGQGTTIAAEIPIDASV